MPEHVIFFVHGMGSFETDWSQSLEKQLSDHFERYDLTRLMGTGKRFSYCGIQYNHIFKEWQDRWKTSADAAAAEDDRNGMDATLAALLLDLAKAPSGPGFFRSHVLDVLLFYSFEAVSQQAQISVAKQIIQRLRQDGENNLPSWSIVAHSLGTAVVAETLHALFSNRIDGISLPQIYQPQCVAMVANTSRLLWNKQGSLYGSRMRPHGLDRLGACRSYLDIRHEIDPVPKIQPFDPPGDWIDPTLDPKRAFVRIAIPREDLASENVHALSHYLSHPAVHIPLIRRLLDFDDAITEKEEINALKRWRKKSLKSVALQKAFDRLEPLLGKKNDTIKVALTKWLRYRLDIALPEAADGEEV